MLPSLQNAKWKLVDTDVDWPRMTSDAGVLQHRRQLALTCELDADGLSVAAYSDWFINAPDTVSNFVIYVGTSNAATTGVRMPPQPFTLTGTWNVERVRVAYSDGSATIRLSLWAYTGTWEDVPESAL